MHTIYDWLTIAIFAAIAVLFLQRSTAKEGPTDRIIEYLPPALGCAAANYFGNGGYDIIAVVLLIATAIYIAFILKPFAGRP